MINPIKTCYNLPHHLSHCANCNTELKVKAWKGKDLGLCYKCFKKWERIELKEQARKDKDPRYQRLRQLTSRLMFTGLSPDEKMEYDSIANELGKEEVTRNLEVRL